MTNSVSVILATYNEAENISHMIEALTALLAGREFEIVVVDDNSPDLTWKVVEEIAAKNNCVRLLRRLDERGLTSAYNAGIGAAKGDVLVWLDCDFQHPVELLPSLLGLVDRGLDAALTSRFLASETAADRPRSVIIRAQIALTWSLNRLATWYIDRRITDWTSGYLAIKRHVLKDYKLRGEHGEYYIHLMRHLAECGFTFKEIPYVLRSRTRGDAKTTGSVLHFFRYCFKYAAILLRPRASA